jgi:hypothetical protein
MVLFVFLFGSTLLTFNTFISFTILFLPHSKSPPPFDHTKNYTWCKQLRFIPVYKNKL